nr:RING-H2 finger protein ATL8-like [Ipomoea batatas]GMC98980.1 RING-H2 finger protein ATL8-like [Ipomoea batatas]
MMKMKGDRDLTQTPVHRKRHNICRINSFDGYKYGLKSQKTSRELNMTPPRRFLSSNNSSPNPPPPILAAAAPEPPSKVVPEPDIVVIIAALLCALMCVAGLVPLARCAWLRRSRRARANGGGASRQPTPSNNGLKKKVLRSLPKFTYGPDFAAAGEQFPADCAICLTEYEDGDEIRVLPQCRHGFHVKCIDTWLGSHSSCPSCRQILVVSRCRKCNRKEIPSVSAAGAGEDSRSTSNNINILG